MEWPVLIGLSGLGITVATILVGLGATLQKLRVLHDGQAVLFSKVEELQKDLKNGITSRLNEHSGVIKVIRTELLSAAERAHAEVVAVRETCALRHGGKNG